MIGRWMKVFGTLRPWVVAVALAGASLAGGCSKGGVATGGDAARPPVAADADEPCEPAVVYGPPPCTKDEDCRRPGQEDWICDPKPMTFEDGCGKTVEWGRVCRPGPSTGAGSAGATGPGAARTDLPPPLPSRDVGPSEE